MAARFRTWVNSDAGPKTTHFWGPVANWGFVLAVREQQGEWRILGRQKAAHPSALFDRAICSHIIFTGTHGHAKTA